MPGSSGQLTFKTRANNLDNVTAVMEASADDGATWQSLYTEQSTTNGGFTTRTVSLAPFAGKHLLLRVRAEPAGTGSISIHGSEGWYVDDIALSGVQSADDPVLSSVSAGTFSLTPAQAGDYDINVRAQFSGSGFGAFSAAKRVTATAGGISLATALDNTNLAFSTSGTA